MNTKKPNFQIISFDIFRTLIDLDSQAGIVFEKIMNRKGSRKEIRKFWIQIGNLYRIELEKTLSKGIYEGFHPLFERVMQTLAKEYKLPNDGNQYASVIVNEEGEAPFFKDALPILNYCLANYKVCIVSDTDPEMVKNILPRLPVEDLFLSCDLNSYKEDYHNTLFQAVLSHYKGVTPSEILHIGDSYSDIVGAQKAGITTCWINRYSPWIRWHHKDVKPNYIIRNLYQLKKIVRARK